jgi:hypothetical protein
MRKAKQYVLLHPDDCDPPHKLDLSEGSRDSLKVEWLERMFREDGFSHEHSALIGYPLNGKIQLVSGTHRHEAARRAGILLPVTLTLRSDVEAYWGTEAWIDFIQDVAVKNLELAPISEKNDPPGLDERVDLTRDIER